VPIARASFWGAPAALPVLFGSLPKRIVGGKLPPTAGWQPALPRVSIVNEGK